MKPLIKLISRVFLAVALCVSSPAAFAGDSSYDIDKERIAQEIREKAMAGDIGSAREQLIEVEQEHNMGTLGYDWRRLLLDRRDAYLKDRDDLMSIVGISEALRKGADINQRVGADPSAPFYHRYVESNALWIAAKSGDYRMVAILLENGADVESETKIWARVAPYYQQAAVRATKPIFASLAPDNNPGDNEKTMRTLLRYGADTEAKDAYNRAPLHYAAARKWREMVEILIDGGADVNVKEGGNGYTNDPGYTPLHYAVWSYWPSEETATAKLLLDRGADVNARSEHGGTPLHSAATGHVNATKLLLDRGADVNAETNNGRTPLHQAAQFQFNFAGTDIVKLLLDHGANINAKIADGWDAGKTPLHFAARDTTSVDVAKMLVARGAEINVKKEDGGTPLHGAAYVEVPATAKLLLENGADVNAKNSKGETPLHRAAVVWVMTPRSAKREEEIIMALIRYGADVNAQTTSDTVYGAAGATPLDYATREYWHHDNTIRLLIEHGARCNVRTGELCGEPVVASEPQADYTGLYANAAFAVAGAFAPSWVDAQTFAFNQGDKFVTGQSLSVPLDDFTFAAKRVQVNDLTDYEFAVKWEMEF